MTTIYEVWTCWDSKTLGVQLYKGTWKDCNSYIEQACSKGANHNNFAIILEDDEIKNQN